MDLHATLPREHLQSSVSSVNLVLLKFVQGPTYVEEVQEKRQESRCLPVRIYKNLKDITSEGPVFNLWCRQGSWLPGGEKSSEFALGAVLHFCTKFLETNMWRVNLQVCKEPKKILLYAFLMRKSEAWLATGPGDSLSVFQPPHFTIKRIQADFLQGTQ